MTLMEQEIKEQPKVIAECAAYNEKAIAELIKDIKTAAPNNILLAARGTSDHAGIFFKYLCEVYVGLPVALAAPSVITSYKGGLKLDKSLVIAVSQSGAAADALECIKRGNEDGAVTVAITNFPDSVVAKEAKHHLFLNCGLEKSVAATKTYGTSLYLLAAIVAHLSGDAGLLNMLSSIPSLCEKTLASTDNYEALASRFRYMSECFYLSRGYLYPMCMEACLKIQETCYVRARAYSVADFHHGPFAMICDNMPVFFYLCDKATDADVKVMVEKVKNVGGDAIVFSNKQEYCDLGNVGIKLPDEAEGPAAIFACAIAAQMFACRLAAVKGLNPDAPRGLTKVTVTK